MWAYFSEERVYFSPLLHSISPSYPGGRRSVCLIVSPGFVHVVLGLMCVQQLISDLCLL